MGIHKTLTRNRSVPGSLGNVTRSIGYLQGGYKDSTIHSKVQSFNTVTQAGSIVYDTGYQRYYRPGITGDTAGYFNISDAGSISNYNKFSYSTASASSSFTTTKNPGVTVSDYFNFTQAWILCSTTISLVDGVEDYVKVNLTTDTPVSKGNLNGNLYSTTRQAMGTTTHGFFIDQPVADLYVLNFTTETVALATNSALLNNGIQIPCGMSVSNSHGYMVGYIGYNTRINVSGATVNSVVSATNYSYNFGESHSIATSTNGYMMAGYADTTGRFGGSQHGLCQGMNLTTEAITTLPDLVLAQSSGQLMQGY